MLKQVQDGRLVRNALAVVADVQGTWYTLRSSIAPSGSRDLLG